MDRDFLHQVIDLKKTLHQEEHRLDLEKSKVDEELLYAKPGTERKLQIELLEIESNQLQTKRKLVRAQLFGLRLSKGFVYHCIACFVDHDALQEMNEVAAKVMGARLVKCDRCGKELILND